MTRTLLVAVYVANADHEAKDPDDLASDLVDSLNGGHTTASSPFIVGGIPAPQWLTPATLANLRANATAKPTATPHPLAVDLCGMVDGMPAEWRLWFAHVITCVPCRQGALNIIQTAKDWPDLYGRNR